MFRKAKGYRFNTDFLFECPCTYTNNSGGKSDKNVQLRTFQLFCIFSVLIKQGKKPMYFMTIPVSIKVPKNSQNITNYLLNELPFSYQNTYLADVRPYLIFKILFDLHFHGYSIKAIKLRNKGV